MVCPFCETVLPVDSVVRSSGGVTCPKGTTERVICPKCKQDFTYADYMLFDESRVRWLYFDNYGVNYEELS